MRLLTFCACAILGTASALAVPAKPTPIKFTQPDGSTVTVMLRGDERHHWYQTLDGYALVNRNNTLYYALPGKTGSLESSGYKATEITLRKDEVRKFLSTVSMADVIETLNRERANSPRVKAERIMIEKANALSRHKVPNAGPVIDDVFGKGLFSNEHFPVFGSQKSLVVLVEYTDVKFNDADVNYAGDVRAYYNDMLNGDNFKSHNATGSARQWFVDNSGAQFQPQFDVYGPVELSRPMAYYGGNNPVTGDDNSPEMMVIEACSQLDATVDFSEYDRDGDGYIDNVYVIYAGRGEASGGEADTVWPHSWNIKSAGVGTYVFDDKILDRYACSNEWENEAPDGIGTFVHEFSHVLGLPDIYSTTYSEAFTPGSFCVMDYGNYNNDGRTPPNYGIFERNALGWLRPKQLTGETVAEYTLRPVDLMDGYAVLTNRADEFFLIENRQQRGWDTYIPGHGMLVWHIDYNSSAWNSNTVNVEKEHQCVDIVEADGIRSKDTYGGDPFPGTKNVTEFTHRTVPAMKTWAGLELKVPLRDIREDSGNIIFNGGYIPVPAPGKITVADIDAADISTTSFTAKWNLDPNTTYYLLNVYNSEHRIIWNRKNAGNTDHATITGLKPDNLYYLSVIPCNEDSDGEPSNEVSVRTLPPTLDFLKTVALEASEVGSTDFTANWEKFDDATDYILNVQQQEATPLVESTCDFTGGIAGMPQGWKTNATGTTDDASLCGTSAPALCFDKKGYMLTCSYPESIKKLYFSLKVSSPAPGARLNVMGMSPGSFAWKEIEVIELDKFEGPLYANTTLPDNLSSIYLEYVAAGDCRIAIDDIRIVYGGTVTSTREHEVYTNFSTGDVSSIRLTGLQPDTQYEYTVQAVNPVCHARVSDTIIVRTKESSGIENIDADGYDAAPEYYNLQGLRVTSPGPGEIYIERRGTTTRKVILK